MTDKVEYQLVKLPVCSTLRDDARRNTSPYSGSPEAQTSKVAAVTEAIVHSCKAMTEFVTYLYVNKGHRETKTHTLHGWAEYQTKAVVGIPGWAYWSFVLFFGGLYLTLTASSLWQWIATFQIMLAGIHVFRWRKLVTSVQGKVPWQRTVAYEEVWVVDLEGVEYQSAYVVPVPETLPKLER